MPWRAKHVSAFDELSNGEIPSYDKTNSGTTSESSRANFGRHEIEQRSFSSTPSKEIDKILSANIRNPSGDDDYDVSGSYYDQSDQGSATGETHSLSSENGWSPRSVTKPQASSFPTAESEVLINNYHHNIKKINVPTAPLDTDSQRSTSQDLDEFEDEFDEMEKGSKYSDFSQHSQEPPESYDHVECGDEFGDDEEEQGDGESLDYSVGDHSPSPESPSSASSSPQNFDSSRGDKMLQGVVNTYFAARSGRDSPMFELENVDYISHFETASNDSAVSTVAFITKEVASGIFCRRLIPLEIPLLNNSSQHDEVSSVSSGSDSSALAAASLRNEGRGGTGRMSPQSACMSEGAVRILQEQPSGSSSDEDDPLRLRNVTYLPAVDMTNDHRDISTVGVLSYAAADEAFQKTKDKPPTIVIPVDDQQDDVSTIQDSVKNLVLVIPSRENSGESMSSMCSGSLESLDVSGNPSDNQNNNDGSDIAVRIRSNARISIASREKVEQNQNVRSVEKRYSRNKFATDQKKGTSQKRLKERTSDNMQPPSRSSTKKKKSIRSSSKSLNGSKHSKARDEIEQEVMKVLLSEKEVNKTISTARKASDQIIAKKKYVKKKRPKTESTERTQSVKNEESTKPKRKPRSQSKRASTTDPALMIQEVEYLPKVDVASHNRDLSTINGHQLSKKDASLAFGLGRSIPQEIPIHDMEDISTIHCEIRCQEEVGGNTGFKAEQTYREVEDEETGFVTVGLDRDQEGLGSKKKMSIRQLKQDSAVAAGKVKRWTSRTAQKVQTGTGPFIENVKKDMILLWRKYMGGRSTSEKAVIIVIAISLFVLFILLLVVLAKG